MNALRSCLLVALGAAAWAAESAPITFTRTDFAGRDAFRLSDGKTEAVIVPSIARVMRYAKVGGENWLWIAAPGQVEQGGWKNHGGEKAWVAPQSEWPLFLDGAWPPDAAWERGHEAAVPADPPRLHMEGPVGKNGIRLIRDFAFGNNGDFVTTTTLEKVSGPALMAGAWTIAQIPPVEAVFLPTHDASVYKNGFFRFGWGARGQVESVAPGLLRVTPSTAGAYKLGVDGPVPAIAARRKDSVFIQRAAREKGSYPDGADGAGFPVELYDHGAAEKHYLEMEMLSPVAPLAAGQRRTFVVRWSLHELPPNADAAEVHRIVARLLGE